MTSLLIDSNGHFNENVYALATLYGYNGTHNRSKIVAFFENLASKLGPEGFFNIRNEKIRLSLTKRACALLKKCSFPGGLSPYRVSRIAHVIIPQGQAATEVYHAELTKELQNQGFKGSIHRVDHETLSQRSLPEGSLEQLQVVMKDRHSSYLFKEGYYARTLGDVRRYIWNRYAVDTTLLFPIPVPKGERTVQAFKKFAECQLPNILDGMHVAVISASATQHYFLLMRCLLELAPQQLSEAKLKARVHFMSPVERDEVRELFNLGKFTTEEEVMQNEAAAKTIAFARMLRDVDAIRTHTEKIHKHLARKRKQKRWLKAAAVGALTLLAGTSLLKRRP